MSAEISVKEKLKLLKTWFRENPNLPEEIDPTLLKRFFKCMNGDLEETKKLVEHNYLLRNKTPQIFIDRNPDDEATKKSFFDVEMVPLPGLTPENYKVLCFRMVNKDPKTQNSIEESKAFFMMTDTRFTFDDVTDKFLDVAPNSATTDDDKDCIDDDMSSLSNGEIHIVDIANYTLRHIANMSLMVMRAYMNFLQEAYPVRLKAMHIINCPTHVNRMVTITKPFIREEVFNMTHFHTKGLDSLFEHVPRDILPLDYGGNARSLADISADWWKIIQSKKTYLMDPRHWKVNKTEEPASRWSLW
ncbi:alpha-tocopherol transfer protein [Musca domestica]|uniref:Alpha-tocopherol transfer protein n=1 Tax=Musca domestica TaxID=7370 RepID=A0A1I8MS03_MUSDO|nr:alpha-tocopherol transfer protein [Musca domestica]